ncbi:MAG: hypothetical protein EP329_07170 [Deltaproteobacteria bacterium]|nr:MAG: hypothetical protein EP329_07170 [Deltaproteobacteria bacterium]
MSGLLAIGFVLASCGHRVVICRGQRGAIVCAERWVRGGDFEAMPDREHVPESSDLRVPYDEGSGAQARDPATLIGQRVRMQLEDGEEIWGKLVGVTDDEVIVNHGGAERRYPPGDIALVAPLRD